MLREHSYDYSEIMVKSSSQEFAKVLFKVLGFPGEHGLLQVQASAPELRVRQGPPNPYSHPRSESLEFAKVYSRPRSETIEFAKVAL